jgi:hypothetical protein
MRHLYNEANGQINKIASECKFLEFLEHCSLPLAVT